MSPARGVVPGVRGGVLVLVALLLTACGRASGPASTPPPPSSVAPGTASASSSGSVSSSAAESASTGTGPVSGTSTPAPASPTAVGSGDDVDVPVPVGTPTTLPPVAPGVAATTTGAAVVLSRSEAVTGEARGAGQTAGPAVRLTVRVTNTGTGPLDLDAVTVDLRDAADSPAPALVGPGARPFAGSLAVGASTEGVYVFGLAEDDRAAVVLLVGVAAAAPVVAIRADISS